MKTKIGAVADQVIAADFIILVIAFRYIK